MKKILLIVALAGLFCFGCQNDKKKSTEKEQTTEVNASKDNQQLKLSEGKKWKANPETNEGVDKMGIILDQHAKEDLEDYKEMGQQLSEIQRYIISECTMEGEAHEELHKWMKPLLGKVKDLRESDSLEKSKEILKNISRQLEIYHQHFE